MGTRCLLFLVLVPFFAQLENLFFQHRCCFCLLWMTCLIIYGCSPASKHVTALYFVFHSEGRVLWQIFWMLINFLFALWTGEGGGERQTDKRSKKESERGYNPRTKLLLFLYSMKTHYIMKIFYMDSIARSSNTVAKHTVCNNIYCVGFCIPQCNALSMTFSFNVINESEALSASI